MRFDARLLVCCFAVVSMLFVERPAWAICGDLTIDPGEVCDDGNVVDGDGCDSNCTFTGCGNGITTVGEQCDDGNVVNGDGCDGNCTVTACGNGVTTAGELCDDGNAFDGDGCDSNCTPTGCGNAVVSPGEVCDDGNLVNGDGCDATCRPTGCGSGAVSGTEQCDDGNLADGDGCSQNCELEFLNPVPSSGDRFGQSIAVVGTSLLVGAPKFDVVNATNSGAAHLFDGVAGTPIRTFANPHPGAGDDFGATVAAFGPNVLVGAPLDDTAGQDAGAVYLFSASSGALIRSFVNPDPGINDHFGAAITTIGNSVLVGAPEDPSGSGGGGVVYMLSATSGAVQQVFLNPTPAGGDNFGSAIAAIGTNRVLIGAPNHGTVPTPNSGEAYLFDAVTGVLVRTIANPTPATGDLFGTSVASFGSNLLIGAPVIDFGLTNSSGAVYLFDGNTGGLLRTFTSPVPVINDAFGYRVASILPDKVVVSARLEDTGALNSGAVYVYHAGTGALLDTFKKPTPAVEDHFGESLAILGQRVLVGTPLDDTVAVDAGAVYSFDDSSCGNGTVEGGEVCDDGNPVDGDGCDSNCRPTGCGNGIVTSGEQCDDGNLVPNDGCSATCLSEGTCGDGAVGPGELCDDGNLVSGDGCDANCRPTGCGNGILTSGEQCDHGANNGVDFCCSVTCQAVDGDVDGVCDVADDCPTVNDPGQANSDGDVFGDACDVCPADSDNDSDDDGFCVGTQFRAPAVGTGDPCSRGSAGTWQEARVTFGRLLRAPGSQTLRMQGTFTTGTNLPIISPIQHGVRLRIIDDARAVIVDEEIPGGLLVPGGLHGWKAFGEPPTKWIYTDRQKPAVHNGIRKLVVKDLSRVSPNRIDVFLLAKSGTYAVSGSGIPLEMSFELNAQAFPPGGTPGRDQCAETKFQLPPNKPACITKPGTVDCK